MSLEQIRAFLPGSREIGFEARSGQELYEWTKRILCEQEYASLGREGKGLVKLYIAKMTGRSRAQVTGMIRQYLDSGTIQRRRGRGRRFRSRYTEAGFVLLAQTDDAHERLSGPATQKILYREFHEFADARFERLAEISVAHIYNLRQRRGYRERHLHFDKTRPTPVAIGERRRPEPAGRPGYLRVDTVHQGDLDGVKGVYHIKAVDEVTQREVVGATPTSPKPGSNGCRKACWSSFPSVFAAFAATTDQ